MCYNNVFRFILLLEVNFILSYLRVFSLNVLGVFQRCGLVVTVSCDDGECCKCWRVLCYVLIDYFRIWSQDALGRVVRKWIGQQLRHGKTMDIVIVEPNDTHIKKPASTFYGQGFINVSLNIPSPNFLRIFLRRDGFNAIQPTERTSGSYAPKPLRHHF